MKKTFILLIVSAICIRLLFFLFAKPLYEDKVRVYDGKQYEAIAAEMAGLDGKNIWPRRLPGYPWLIAACMKLSSSHYLLMLQFIQILISAGIALLIYYSAVVLLKANHLHALAMSFIWCIFPHSLRQSLLIAPEELLMSSLVLATVAWIYALVKNNIYAAFLAGLSLGVACLVKASPVYVFPLVFLLTGWFIVASKGKMVKYFGAFLLPVIVSITAVSTYNYFEWGSYFYSKSGYYEMYASSKPEYLKTSDVRMKRVAEDFVALGIIDSVNVPEATWEQVSIKDEIFKKHIINDLTTNLQSDPFSVVAFYLYKWVNILYNTDSGRYKGLLLAISLGLIAITVLGIWACYLSKSREQMVISIVLFTVFLAWVTFHMLVVPLNRYMYVITPLLLMAGSNSLTLLNYKK